MAGHRSIDVLVPVSHFAPQSTPERLRTLQFALDTFYLGGGASLNVIIVEQSLDGNSYYLGNLKGDFRGYLIRHNKFNKCWCINYAFNKGGNPVVAVVDADVWAPQGGDYWEGMMQWFCEQQSHWAFGWNRRYETTLDEKNLLMSGDRIQGLDPQRLFQPERGMYEGDVVVFRREFFREIGMADERIVRLNGPDNSIAERARAGSGSYYAYDAQVYHLWHPQTPVNARQRMINRQILFKTRRDKLGTIRFLQNLDQGREQPVGKAALLRARARNLLHRRQSVHS